MKTRDLAPIASRPASVALFIASLVMFAALLNVGRWLTFWTDEWAFIIDRGDPSVNSLLRRHVDHFSLIPVLVYQALFRLVGLRTYLPYLLVEWVCHFACVWLLFWITARRAGWGLGLMAGLSMLFLGSGFENLLHAFQLTFALSEATGLVAIAVLLRPEPERLKAAPIIAAGTLCIAVASSGAGFLFVMLALLWAALRRDGAVLRAALPALGLWIAWFIGWGPVGRVGSLSGSALLWAPIAIANGLGAGVAGLLGAPPRRFAVVGIVIGLVALTAARLAAARLSPLGQAAGVVLVIEYALVAALRAEFGLGWGARSQYVYLGVIFLWLLIPDLASPLSKRIDSWRARAAVAVMLLIAVGGNMIQFAGAARDMRILRATESLEFRLLEALRGSPDLDLDVALDPVHVEVTPRQYFAVIDRLGTPHLACCEPSLTAPPPAHLPSVDRALMRLIGRSVRPAPDGVVAGTPPSVQLAGDVPGGHPIGACLAVEGGARGTRASWRPAAHAFALRGVSWAEPDLRVGVFAGPAENFDAGVRAAAVRGDVIRLPRLPAPQQWSLQILIPREARVEICNAVAS